jgi:predicted dehydrogenase
MSEMTTTDTTEPIEYMLTTVDNPFDPFTQFEEWMQYDVSMGYNTAAFLDRIAKVSNDLSQPDQALAIQNAIDEIVQENVSGMWRKVSKDSFK